MCDAPGNFLMTYDPNQTELHTDSSDFEDLKSPVTPKNGNHSLLKKKKFTKSKKNSQLWRNQEYTETDASSKEMWESQTIIQSQNGKAIDLAVLQTYQNKKSKILDSGDQIETIRSKRSLIRHKVIPCLSNMFGRSSNNVKQMSVIKENQVVNANINSGCQATFVNGEHKLRKFNRRQQCFAVQPVYAVEGNVHAKSTPFQHTKIVREPLLTRKTVGNQNSNVNYSLTSSSEGSENRRLIKRKYGKKFKHMVEPDIGKEFLKHYEGPDLKHIEQQCPSKASRKWPYQVYTNPCQYQQMSTGCSPITSNANRFSGSELPSTCSGFWDYLFNKINMKYQAQAAAGVFKPCKCNNSLASTPCSPINCNTPTRQHNCSCNTSPLHSSPLNLNQNIQSRPSPVVPPFNLKPVQEKVECKCFPRKKSSPRPTGSPMGPPIGPPMGPQMGPPSRTASNEVLRPCQLTHEDITGTLTQKYNGEILCIHNPPCVLINGCLNLPPPKEELTTSAWPVTHSKKTGYCCQLYDKKSLKKPQAAQYGLSVLDIPPCQIMDVSCQYFPPAKEVQLSRINDESCQYQPPSIEMKQLMITDEGCQYQKSPIEIKRKGTANESCQYRLPPPDTYKQQDTINESCQFLHPIIEVKELKCPQPKKEKIVQSICSHNPPCEVIRTCCKTTFDPKLQNSCVHVPMCEKVPLCLMELKSQNQTITSCQHKPRCAEVPICTRNYIVLTAKEEVATQVRPKGKMVCRHEPPCIMIPTCLARVCDSYIPYDAIPDCIHQPMCEMIPACCRKSAKEMVSVCSQYPNQCCIV